MPAFTQHIVSAFRAPYLASRAAARSLAVGMCAAICFGNPAPAVGATRAQPDELRQMTSSFYQEHTLSALLVQVRIGGNVAFEHIQGQAMPQVPVTRDGHFRNGAVTIAYMAATLLKMSEDGMIDLDTPIARWLPDLPEAKRVTPRMLANMTSGYADYVSSQAFIDAFYANPFRTWTNAERIAISTGAPRPFAPGENWDYSHAGYVILGEVMQAAAGKPLKTLLHEYISGPLALNGTHSIDTPAIPEPAIHGYSAERGVFEDSTFWNPSWTLPEGAVQVSTIDDMARSFDTLVGKTGFLPEALRREMLAPTLIGFGRPLDGCHTCHTLTSDFYYGLGVFKSRDWAFQSPRFGGYTAMVATLPEEAAPDGRRVTIAVSVTVNEATYPEWSDDLENLADTLTRRLSAVLVPDTPMAQRRR